MFDGLGGKGQALRVTLALGREIVRKLGAQPFERPLGELPVRGEMPRPGRELGFDLAKNQGGDENDRVVTRRPQRRT
jgi:hypothetical protein